MGNKSRFSEETPSTSWSSSFQTEAILLDEGSSDRTSIYLQDIRHEAHRLLDAGRAEAIVLEVAAHLTDEIDAQVHDGIARAHAEREALSSFGDARRFVGRVADAASTTPLARRAQQMTLLFMLFLALFFVTAWFFPDWGHDRYHGVVKGVTVLCGLLFAVGSFLGRKFQWRQYSGLIAAPLVMIAFLSGYSNIYVRVGNPAKGILIQRQEVAQRRETDILMAEEIKLEIALLETGVKAYQNANAPIPSQLLQNGHFIVPRPYGYRWQNAFRQARNTPAWTRPGLPAQTTNIGSYFSNPGLQRSYLNVLAQTPYPTVTRREDAQFNWTIYGERWLKLRRHDLQALEQEAEACTIVAANPYLFNTHYALHVLRPGPIYEVYFLLLLVHGTAAYIGQLSWRSYSQWVWRLRHTQ